jgi:sulfide:quinone oxidoreductase
MTFRKQRLLVLGAGTAGTMTVNRLRRRLHPEDWEITVVDRDDVHPYQPGSSSCRSGRWRRSN